MKTFARLAVGASMFAFAGAAYAGSAQMVVIDSKGSPLPQGTVISADETLNLSAGAQVTLLGSDGTPVTLTGPFNGKPTAGAGAGGDSKVVAALAGLFQAQKKSTASLGAVRAAGTSASDAVPEAWLINVEAAGDRCIRKGGAVLYRADDGKTQNLKLTGGYRSGKTEWLAGVDRMNMPAGFFADGQTYQAVLGVSSVDLTIHEVPTGLNDAETAAFMAGKGCTGQAMALLTSMR